MLSFLSFHAIVKVAVATTAGFMFGLPMHGIMTFFPCVRACVPLCKHAIKSNSKPFIHANPITLFLSHAEKCVGRGLKDSQVLCGNGEVRSNYAPCGPSRGYRVSCPPNAPYLCARKNHCGRVDQCCDNALGMCEAADGIAACPREGKFLGCALVITI